MDQARAKLQAKLKKEKVEEGKEEKVTTPANGELAGEALRVTVVLRNVWRYDISITKSLNLQ